MRRRAIAASLLILGVSAPVMAAPTTAELMAAPHQFVDSIDKGKFDVAAAALTGSTITTSPTASTSAGV